VILVGLGIAAWKTGRCAEYSIALRRGGWLMLALVGAIGIFAAVSFWQFFTLFHKLFFTGDSWLFLYSDTLIRLFPLRFWQDIFIFVPALTAILGLVLGLGLRNKANPRNNKTGERPTQGDGVS
jgi:integral membrane protein (TIGR01906 family)